MSVPDLIGRYRLLRKLGSGGFAVVWLARDESLETPIAIKIMAENWADRLDLHERFLTEARMLRQAASSRVVQVFDIGELPDGRPYFVMEYADRGTLADRTAVRRIPLVEALRVMAEVTRGVAELHSAGIVHRDLKPSNVLIRSTPAGGERYLVADLGVAKSLARASGLTMSVGSAGYMAPEQSQPQIGVDVRADLYSLGALAFHLITGADPGPPGQVLPRDQYQQELPEPVRRLLLRALEPNRDRRWPDAASFAVELDALADRYASVALQAKPSKPGRRRLVALGALLVVALAAAGFGGTVYWRGRNADITVTDKTAQISVVVPHAWGRQLVPTGWDPGALNLSGSHEPGLLVASDFRTWNNLGANVNGVFIGRATETAADLTAAVGKIQHPGCQDDGGRSYSAPGSSWQASIHHWSSCSGGSRSLDEIVLADTGPQATGSVYLQVRQANGSSATVNRLLDRLRITD
jgi:hypothetical protein